MLLTVLFKEGCSAPCCSLSQMTAQSAWAGGNCLLSTQLGTTLRMPLPTPSQLPWRPALLPVW